MCISCIEKGTHYHELVPPTSIDITVSCQTSNEGNELFQSCCFYEEPPGFLTPLLQQLQILRI